MKVRVSKESKFTTKIKFAINDGKLSIKDFEGNAEEIAVRYEGNDTVVYCGLGNQEECTAKILRSVSAKAVAMVISLKREKIDIIDPKLDNIEDSRNAIVEGALLRNYSFDKYKSEKTHILKEIVLVTQDMTNKEIKDILKIVEGVHYARDLINDNAHEIYPETLANVARDIAKTSPLVTCEILTEKEIKAKKLGLLQAVGQASIYPPRLIIFNYNGHKSSKKKTAIIGKGITFDSGGLNLKPSGHIETMRCDMSGAAVVMGLMKTLIELKPKINVVSVIPAAQSAIGAKAYFPGDIYTSFSGKTVEIRNTDAEGRLVLADAISYCQKKYKPTEIIDLATLTGAIVISLGDLAAGLFSNNDTLSDKLLKSAKKTAEELWRMPLTKEHEDSIKGDFSDIINTSKLPSRHAGSSTAAAFLKAFVEKDTPWAHLDIAGTAFNEREVRGEMPKYATGFGVRLLVNYLLDKQ